MDGVVDARRHERRVHHRQLLGLRPGAQQGPAFDHDVELVRGAVLASGLVLLRLEADQVADQPRPVYDTDADRLLLQEAPRALKTDYVHGV